MYNQGILNKIFDSLDKGAKGFLKWDEFLNGIILAEVWPSLNQYTEIEHPIKDARQVLACLCWLQQENDSGSIQKIFEAPNSLNKKEQELCRTEEGWILGVK